MDSEFLSDRRGTFAINVAQNFDIKQVRELLITLDMFDANTGADDRDSERETHGIEEKGLKTA